MSTSLNTLIVERVELATPEVIAVDLVDASGATLPVWEPGAHIDLHLPSGTIRQYSLCGDPADRQRYRVGILRDANGRGGSIEAHETLAPGVAVQVSVPRNHFALKEASAYLFVAGGIGVTPLLPMLRAVHAAGTPWQLVYGGRTRESMAFVEELAQYPAKRVSLLPQDSSGLIDLAGLVAHVAAGTALYSCGPGPMLNALEQVCMEAGKSAQLHIERFSAPTTQKQDGGGEQRAFKVELAKSGLTLDVAAGQSLKATLVKAAIPVPFSCEEGYCGSCETRVIGGEPEHHDSVLTPEEREEGKFMMVCVGRCKSDLLVLDL
ncbi:PDR/VanB family oxidoreductase [Noviherbaspirillum sedimenti]|uniref:Oxidoreductase n=1 Tax=Noviherbaspirillum sedimenti TaxID=2320865 RepID=A0A3A3GNU0_9BURK|nr:PDR/VanB family oxidoreductase [Noviherbaspirillum sedimenti]RJG02620.1 oxidoreductase [Noviherbaspirillum sedimenti]